MMNIQNRRQGSELAACLLAALSMILAAPGPAVADSAYGCTFPGPPSSEELTERSWDARGLVMFLREQGTLEVKNRHPEAPLALTPEYQLWMPGSREPVAAGEGRGVKLNPGEYSLGEGAGDDFWQSLTETMAENVSLNFSRGMRIHSAHSMEHGEKELRFPREKGVVALTIEFPFTSEQIQRLSESHSHKLVLYLLPAVQKVR